MNFIQLHFDRIKRLILFFVAMFIRTFSLINEKRVFMWSFHFDKYACNPRAITEYLLSLHPSEYEIFWAFEKGAVPRDLDKRIKCVRKYSLAYFRAMYTSKFVITNLRNYMVYTMFKKKRGQKYIMTWHSSIRLKRIEKDAAEQLGEKYMKRAALDSEMCDLMLSNSRLFTSQLRNSFGFNGEILENCIPRNCMFYDETKRGTAYIHVRKSMGFDFNSKIVLYAPTFRNKSSDLKFYQINWDKVIPKFEEMLGGSVKVLLRLHPNMSKIKDLSQITNYDNVYDVTQTPDITEYLFASDVMITDYTSAMFDFAILRKPCFIYAVDKKEYDRGFYWELNQLPFPVAESEKQLIDNIAIFSVDSYNESLDRFIHEVWGLDEDGQACERFYNWMKAQR